MKAKKSTVGLDDSSSYNFIAQDTSGAVKASIVEPQPMSPIPGVVKWEGEKIKQGAALSTEASLRSLRELK